LVEKPAIVNFLPLIRFPSYLKFVYQGTDNNSADEAQPDFISETSPTPKNYSTHRSKSSVKNYSQVVPNLYVL